MDGNALRIVEVAGVRLAGVAARAGAESVDNLSACRLLFGEKTDDVVKATGILTRRLAPAGTTPFDLCCAAAEDLFAAGADDPACARSNVRAVLFVSFTEPVRMPAAACRAQARLALPRDVLALDLSLACSGYVAGLHLAATLARDLGGAVLLLDGDVQSAVTDPADAATVPVLADAGTATLVVPDAAATRPWRFAFLSDGAGGAALQLAKDGTIRMDGFGVFRFVATAATAFLRDFLAAADERPDAFAPHQANVYMIRALAKALGLEERLLVSGDRHGNPASASVPLTLAVARPQGRLFLAGFGGGLAAGAALVDADARTLWRQT